MQAKGLSVMSAHISRPELLTEGLFSQTVKVECQVKKLLVLFVSVKRQDRDTVIYLEEERHN